MSKKHKQPINLSDSEPDSESAPMPRKKPAKAMARVRKGYDQEEDYDAAVGEEDFAAQSLPGQKYPCPPDVVS